MIACDTSVLVAAFSRWHEQHALARAAVTDANALVDHVVVETYSVLTRLPPPRRVPPDLVREFLAHHFPSTATRLTAPAAEHVVEIATAQSITGGAVYDLLVGLTAASAGTTLITLDQRATRTYRAADVEFRLLDG